MCSMLLLEEELKQHHLETSFQPNPPQQQLQSKQYSPLNNYLVYYIYMLVIKHTPSKKVGHLAQTQTLNKWSRLIPYC